ncbi:MAG: hypothetical protein R6U91_02540 [Bacillota bacterium]
MKKLVLVLAIVLVLSGIFAVSALTQVDIERDVTATVASDTHDDVAVKFEVLNDYDDVAEVDDTTGEISFDLDGVLNSDLTTPSFNVVAEFHIGSEASPVFSITNNTSDDIQVTVDSVTEGGVSLRNADDGSEWTDDTIESANTQEYYFELDTNAINVAPSEDALEAEYTLQIRLVD